MPDPLAMPVTVTGTLSITIRRDAPLGTVSVVMMADTARNQCSGARASNARGSAATIFSTGSGSMITPVENGSTSPGAQSSIEATAAHVLSAAAMPAAPVRRWHCLRSRQRIRPPPARCSRHTITGAAQKRFCVNTPAAVVPGSNTASSTSSRSQRLIFAAAVPSRTPGTGSKSSARGGV
jgi:hypothetical protein